MPSLDRRSLLALGAALSAAGCVSSTPSAPRVTAGGEMAGAPPLLVDIDRGPDLEIDLWSEGPPGGGGEGLNPHVIERVNPYGLPDRARYDITRPALAFFRAQEPDGSAILIIPGGAYAYVVIEKEGWESARHFNRRGAHCYVLSYRLPHQGWAAGAAAPLQDAQRAIRIIRARAGTDGADPARIAVIGFSAGGHLAGSLATRFAEETYPPADHADALSARPDLAALIYPVVTMRDPHAHAGSRTNLIGAAPSNETIARYSLETAPPPETPPVFLMHAADDETVPLENALLLHQALRKAKIPSALHVFQRGGHGFGVRSLEGMPAALWPDLFQRWAAGHGFAASPAR